MALQELLRLAHSNIEQQEQTSTLWMQIHQDCVGLLSDQGKRVSGGIFARAIHIYPLILRALETKSTPFQLADKKVLQTYLGEEDRINITISANHAQPAKAEEIYIDVEGLNRLTLRKERSGISAHGPFLSPTPSIAKAQQYLELVTTVKQQHSQE